MTINKRFVLFLDTFFGQSVTLMNHFYRFASHTVFSSLSNLWARWFAPARSHRVLFIFMLCLVFAYGSVPLPVCAQEPLMEKKGSGLQKAEKKRFSPTFPTAFPSPIDMNADHLEMDREKGEIKAEGDVRVTRTDLLDLRADRVKYLFSSKQIQASGNIRLIRRGDLFTSERVVFDVGKQSGTLHQVTIDLRGPGGLAAAETVIFRHEKNGPDRDFITLKDAFFTNCECDFRPNSPAPPWHFKAKKVDVDRADNTVTARNIWLYAGNVPVLALPWWQQPLVPKRKSGLLMPKFRMSGNGFEAELPFFWNIAEDRDATLALRSISRRGLMTKLQYRYLGQSFKGQLDTHGIYDTLDERYRGLFLFENEHALGDWNLRSHLEGSLTRDFINDFSQQLVDNHRRRLESSATLDRLWTHGHGYTRAQTGMRWYQDLEKDNDDFTVQSLPFVTLSDRRVLGGHLESGPKFGEHSDLLRGHWRLDSEAHLDNFYQMAGNSSQRVNIAPTIHFQKPIYIGRASAALGLRETAYLLHADPDPNRKDRSDVLHREAALASLRLDGTLRKLYGNAYLHTLEPSLQYVLNVTSDQGKLPNYDASLRRFTITDIFARNLYSGVDRISDGQWIGYGLTSRLLGHEEKNSVWEAAVLTVGQRWAPSGYRKYQGGRAFSSVASSLEVKFSKRMSAETMVNYNPYKKDIESSDTVFSVAFSDTDLHETAKNVQRGRVTLRHHFNTPDFSGNPDFLEQPSLGLSSLTGDLIENGREKVDDLSLDAALRLSENWTWNQRSGYSLEFSEIKSWDVGLTYKHPCWDLTLTGGRELATTTNKHGGGFIGFFINLQGLGGVGI